MLYGTENDKGSLQPTEDFIKLRENIMEVSLNKKYEAKNGSTVELVSDKGREPYIFIGYLNDDSMPSAWNREMVEVDEAIHGDVLNLVEISHYKDWKVDDKVWVKSLEDEQYVPRHFAGVSHEYEAECFSGGKTSFTSKGYTVSWRYAIKSDTDPNNE